MKPGKTQGPEKRERQMAGLRKGWEVARAKHTAAGHSREPDSSTVDPLAPPADPAEQAAAAAGAPVVPYDRPSLKPKLARKSKPARARHPARNAPPARTPAPVAEPEPDPEREDHDESERRGGFWSGFLTPGA